MTVATCSMMIAVQMALVNELLESYCAG